MNVGFVNHKYDYDYRHHWTSQSVVTTNQSKITYAKIWETNQALTNLLNPKTDQRQISPKNTEWIWQVKVTRIENTDQPKTKIFHKCSQMH